MATFALPMMVVVFVVAAALTFVVAPGLIWLYGHSVRRSMTSRAGLSDSAGNLTPIAAAHPTNSTCPSLDLRLLDARGDPNQPRQQSAQLRAARQSFWSTAVVYAAAGAVHAAVATILLFSFSKIEFLPYRTFSVYWAHLWPAVLVFGLFWLSGWRTRVLLAAGYFAVFLTLALSSHATTMTRFGITFGPVEQMFLIWGLGALLPTVLLFFFLNRRIRAVGPLVYVFMLVAVLGGALANALSFSPGAAKFVVGTAVKLKLDVGTVVWSFVAIGFVLFLIPGWLGAAWIRRRYEAKQLSDQSVMIDSIWMVFTLSQILMDLAQERGVWAILGLTSFLSYRIARSIGFRILRRRSPPCEGVKLLLLRVFGSRRRSEKLFDVLTARWRYYGSVQMIAGTDLATSQLEPHEFLDFLRGRLTRYFIANQDQLESRVEQIDLLPDFDRRFRVTEFFCFDDTWRLALRRLTHRCDRVLMDLRGFTSQHAGCIFELQTLISDVPPDRVLLLVDSTTDLPYLRQVLAGACLHIVSGSANAKNDTVALRVLEIRGRIAQGVQRILEVFDEPGAAAQVQEKSA
ncbi:MAG: hypothetical protein LAO56_03465 [Acidobacteriia bacterium]|nr:hypothetical protein [Terriglobia bacterium]